MWRSSGLVCRVKVLPRPEELHQEHLIRLTLPRPYDPKPSKRNPFNPKPRKPNPHKRKHKHKHRLDLANLVQAALLYGHGQDHDRKRILQAFIYGRFNIERIGRAHVQAIIDVRKAMVRKAASVEMGRWARSRAAECIQAANASAVQICREKDITRMGLLNSVCLRGEDQKG